MRPDGQMVRRNRVHLHPAQSPPVSHGNTTEPPAPPPETQPDIDTRTVTEPLPSLAPLSEPQIHENAPSQDEDKKGKPPVPASPLSITCTRIIRPPGNTQILNIPNEQ